MHRLWSYITREMLLYETHQAPGSQRTTRCSRPGTGDTGSAGGVGGASLVPAAHAMEAAISAASYAPHPLSTTLMWLPGVTQEKEISTCSSTRRPKRRRTSR